MRHFIEQRYESITGRGPKCGKEEQSEITWSSVLEGDNLVWERRKRSGGEECPTSVSV